MSAFEIEGLLALAKKSAEEAEVFVVCSEQSPVVFEANRLKQLQTRQSMSVALRIVRQGRIGFATSTDLDDWGTLVDRAVEVSQFGALASFQLPGQSEYPHVDIYDARVESFPTEQMIDLGESLISRVRGHTPDLLCDARVARSMASVQIMNSRGAQASFRQTAFRISLEGNLIRNSDMLFVGDSESSCQPIEDIDNIAASVIRQLELARRQASVSSGRLPVVFTPHGVVSAFVAPLGAAFNGRVVLQGASPLGNRRGDMVFDERLSLRDDGTLGNRPGSRPCDDEGVPSQVTPLIENGLVAGFLYDLQTAGLAGAESTGSGDRGGGSALPGPSTSSLVFEPGDAAFEDMVRDVSEGLVVEQLMGAAQTNILGGEFSGNVLLGFRIEGGEIVGRVKDTVVSGNVYQALNKVLGIGREARWVGSVFTPAICCCDLTIGSKA